MNLADSILSRIPVVRAELPGTARSQCCPWVLLWIVALLAFPRTFAFGQQYLTDPDQYSTLDIKRVATISSSRDVLQQHAISPAAELTLTIIAGKAEHNGESERIVRPVAAITDSKGRLLVADTEPLSIRVLDFPRQKYHDISLAGIGVQSIGGLAVNHNDVVYVSDSLRGRVVKLNPKGQFLGYLQDPKDNEAYFMWPAGIAIDHHHGTIYVCDRDRHMVIKMNMSGRVLAKIGKRGGGEGPGEFHQPTQITVRKNEIFVLDSGNHRVQRFDLDGVYRGETRIRVGSGLAVDEARLYLSEPDLNRIAVFSRDGTLVTSFDGQQKAESEKFDPAGLWLASTQCLYVADKANGKVEVLSVSAASKCR